MILFIKNYYSKCRMAQSGDIGQKMDFSMQKGGRPFVPSVGGLRKELLKETHDTVWASHPGVERTLALLSCSWY